MLEGSKWSSISLKLQGRNPYSVKNRFYSLCNKRGISKENSNREFELEKLIEEMTFRRKKIKLNELYGNPFGNESLIKQFEKDQEEISMNTVESSESSNNLFVEKFLSF